MDSRSLSYFGGLLLVLLCLFGCLSAVQAQVNLTIATPSNTQNFDGMGTSATASLPANWKMSPEGEASPTWTAGGNLTAVNQQASSGMPNTGGRYNWGSTTAERALGVITSGGYAPPNSIMAHYRNNEASAGMSGFKVSYKGEQYRRNITAAFIKFYYSTDGSAWTAVPAGDIAAASFPTGSNSHAFNPPLTTINVSEFTVEVSIAAGTNFYLRWELNTGASNSQGIGIDDVVVTAVYAPTVTTTAISAISTTTASGGGSSITENGSAITAKGVVWHTATAPTVALSTKTNDGTGTTNFSSSLTSLSPQTLYYYRAYVTNANGTGYGSESTFRTLSNQPTGQASALSLNSATDASLTVQWTAATFPVSGATTKGYVLLRGTNPGDVPSFSSANGAAPAAGPNTTIVDAAIPEATTTATASGLSATSSYRFLLVPYCWDGTNASTYHYLSTGAPTLIASTTGPLPTLSVVTASAIVNTTASSGGNALTDGGSAITAKGVVWDVASLPTIALLTKTNDGTGTANFSSSLTGLAPQTQYFYRAYATNGNGTAYSTQLNFRTLSNPPSAQATALTVNSATSSSITLGWTAATFPVSGATAKGYVLLRGTNPGDVPSLSSANGTAPAAGPNTTIVSSSIGEAVVTQTVTGLSVNSTYHFLLVPYCWNGSNANTYHYLTTSAPTVSGATTSNVSVVQAVASSEADTISSVINTALIATNTQGTQVWQIDVFDGNGAANDADGLPTIYTGLTITPGTGNSVTDWSAAVQSAALFRGSTLVSNSPTISAGSIAFSGIDVTVADGAASKATLSLRISLKNSGLTEGQRFVFSLTNANVSVAASNSSQKSGFATLSSVNSATKNVVNVTGTRLRFGVQPPSSIQVSTVMSPAPTVQATDVNGNADSNFAGSVTLTGVGSTISGTLSATAVSGTATFSNIQFSPAALSVYITASGVGLTAANSATFQVLSTSSESDMVAVASSEADTISSLANASSPFVTGSTQRVQVWQITLRDGGSDLTDNDTWPTILNSFTLTQGASNTVPSWTAVVNAAEIWDGTTRLAAGSVTASTIAFSGLSVTAADNSSRTLTLFISLKNSGITDDQRFQFQLTDANITLAATASSRKIPAGSGGIPTLTSSASRNLIAVTGTRLAFVVQPGDIAEEAVLTTAPTVQSTDANGNRDLSFVGSVSVSVSGSSFFSATTSATAVAGLATFSNLRFSPAGASVILTASATGQTNGLSSAFVVFQKAGTNVYRSKQDGNWSAVATWEVTNDGGGSWANAATAPNAGNAGIILVRHAVSFDASATVDEVAVTATGTLTIPTTGSPTLTLSDGNGVDLAVYGLLILQGNDLAFNTGATMRVENGGTYRHAKTLGTVPTAGWGTNSTIEITAVVSSNDVPTGNWGQDFGNFKWNCAGQTSNSVTLPGGLTMTIYGNLIINDAGTGTLNLTGSSNRTVNVKGDLILSNNANFTLTTRNSGPPAVTGNGVATLNVDGNININSGSQLRIANNSASTNPGTYRSVITLKGNLTVNGDITMAGGEGSGESTMRKGHIIFDKSGTQTISVGASSIIEAVDMTINSGSTVQMQNSFDLDSYEASPSTTERLTMTVNGTLDFGFNGTNPNILGGNASFVLGSAGTLKITSPDGIDDGSTTVGNIRTSGATRTLPASATYWYTGIANQVAGDGLPASNITGKVIIDNPNTVRLSQATTFSTNGTLDIRQGTFYEQTNFITAGTGANLLMASGTTYRIDNNATLLPRLEGTYTLTEGSTIILGGSANQQLRGGRTYQNLTFTNGGTKTLSTATPDILGTVTIDDADVIVDTQSSSFGGDVTNFTMTAGRYRTSRLSDTQPRMNGTYNLTGGTVELYGTSATQQQSFRGEKTYFNVELNATAANYTPGESNVLQGGAANTITRVNGTFTVKSPTVYRITQSVIEGSGNFVVEAGATLKYGDPNGITASAIGTNGGNIKVSGTRSFPTTASYGFVGGENMVTGDGLPAACVNIFVDKTNPSNTVTLTNALSVNGSLSQASRFDAGRVITSNSLLLTFGLNASVTAASNNSHVQGPCAKVVDSSTNFDFPIGKGGIYRPSGVLAVAGTGTFRSEYFPTPYSSLTPVESPLTWVSQLEYWMVDQIAGTPSAKVRLYWNTASDVNASGAQRADLRVARWDGSTWRNHGGENHSGTATAGSLNSTDVVASFSPFTLSTLNGANLLPVVLTRFEGRVADRQAVLSWTTAHEADAAWFEVQRSGDGRLFGTVGRVQALGRPSQYLFRDPGFEGAAYYRLRQVDLNGSAEYSQVIWLAEQRDDFFAVLPNPGNIPALFCTNPGRFGSAESLRLQVTDATGRFVWHTDGHLAALNGRLTEFFRTQTPGLYVLIIQSSDEQWIVKWVKE